MSRLVSLAKSAILFTVNSTIKFLYGFLFGALLWYIMVHPYSRYFSFEDDTYVPEFVFSLIVAFLFMSFLWIRAMMILVLPNLVGNATQNYIIILLFISLFSNPVANIALNSIESVRVIGCTIMMTFEQLKERTKLILNPVIEVLSDRDQTDLEPIRQDLVNIQDTILQMRHEAEFNRKMDEESDKSILKAKAQVSNLKPDIIEVSETIKNRLEHKLDPSKTQDLVNKTMELFHNSTIDLDMDRMGLRVGLDRKSVRNFVKSNRHLLMDKNSGEINEFNLTEIMYQNCLGIFRRAKMSCEEAVEDMRKSCQDTIGTIFAAIWCSPISFTLSQTCPWIMDQILDENSLCKELKIFSSQTKNDPFNVTGGSGDINDVFKNLTQKFQELNEGILEDDSSSLANGRGSQPERLELTITLNDATKSLFFKANQLIVFIRDRYKLRKLFYDMLLFLYDMYTTGTFICIILQAYKYQQRYLSNVRYDNHYITGMFSKYNQQQQQLTGQSLLPLTRDESEKYITTFTCKRRTKEEKKTQKASCASIIVFLAMTVSLIYFDDIYSSILNSIHEHALIRFKEVGHHALNVTVVGDGSIARLVRKLTGNLNSIYDMNRLYSTKMCLPDTAETGSGFYLEFSYLCVLYLFIDQISIYAMRLRHVIAGFFYPEKEKQKIRFLYNLIELQRQRANRMGFASYVNEIDDDQYGETRKGQRDENIYTIRDALGYMRQCVSDSLRCRQSKCCRCFSLKNERPKKRLKPT